MGCLKVLQVFYVPTSNAAYWAVVQWFTGRVMFNVRFPMQLPPQPESVIQMHSVLSENVHTQYEIAVGGVFVQPASLLCNL